MIEGHREKLLDQALADTFPASDPVSVAQPGGGAESAASQPSARPQPNKDVTAALAGKPRS